MMEQDTKLTQTVLDLVNQVNKLTDTTKTIADKVDIHERGLNGDGKDYGIHTKQALMKEKLDFISKLLYTVCLAIVIEVIAIIGTIITHFTIK